MTPFEDQTLASFSLSLTDIAVAFASHSDLRCSASSTDFTAVSSSSLVPLPQIRNHSPYARRMREDISQGRCIIPIYVNVLPGASRVWAAMKHQATHSHHHVLDRVHHQALARARIIFSARSELTHSQHSVANLHTPRRYNSAATTRSTCPGDEECSRTLFETLCLRMSSSTVLLQLLPST